VQTLASHINVSTADALLEAGFIELLQDGNLSRTDVFRDQQIALYWPRDRFPPMALACEIPPEAARTRTMVRQPLAPKSANESLSSTAGTRKRQMDNTVGSETDRVVPTKRRAIDRRAVVDLKTEDRLGTAGLMTSIPQAQLALV
jgi:hypothetical protein